jgi:hypothetical protein
MSATSAVQTRATTAAFSWPTDRAARTAIDTILILLALLAPTLAALALDARQINGAAVWLKPLHFQLALIVHFATLAALLQLMSPAGRASRMVRWSMTAAATASVGEIGYIMLQAARGRASHFNYDTPIEAAMYPLMGIGAVTIVVGAFLAGVGIWRDDRRDIGTSLRLGAILGLTLGAVATLIVAATMSSGVVAGPGHWVGGVRSDVNGLPFFGWSTTGGDLRVPHFFATHAIQALPVVGLLADRLLGPRASAAVWIATAFWLILVVATFVQALAGAPFLH